MRSGEQGLAFSSMLLIYLHRHETSSHYRYYDLSQTATELFCRLPLFDLDGNRLQSASSLYLHTNAILYPLINSAML
jgi:hypothetical protein